MDGPEGRVAHSIQARLSLALSVCVLVAAILAGLFAYRFAREEALELQDQSLREVATLFDESHLPSPNRARERDADEDAHILVQRLGEPDTQDSASHSPLFPADLPDGLQDVALAGETYRTLVKTVGPQARIAIAQEADVRNETARESAVRTMLPFLLLVPLLPLVMIQVVKQLFMPLQRLAKEIDARPENSLAPIEESGAFREIQPFIGAINGLLGRVTRSVEVQRRFVADAAHEMRTPLTAMQLQAERLAATDMSEEAARRLGTLREGIQRNQVLVRQLLAFASVQSEGSTEIERVPAATIFARALEDIVPLAESKGVEIGVVKSEGSITGHALALVTLVKNLADNAVRYSPSGTQVDLAAEVRDGGVVLSVSDSGPGVPEEERMRIFDAFYRAPGTGSTGAGLGLSIVAAIAERHRGRIWLEVPPGRASGLKVNVWLPDA